MLWFCSTHSTKMLLQEKCMSEASIWYFVLGLEAVILQQKFHHHKQQQTTPYVIMEHRHRVNSFSWASLCIYLVPGRLEVLASFKRLQKPELWPLGHGVFSLCWQWAEPGEISAGLGHSPPTPLVSPSVLPNVLWWVIHYKKYASGISVNGIKSWVLHFLCPLSVFKSVSSISSSLSL